MIDDELYQFASDELNSDRRIPTLWDRACALARDDHDEARFLYQNLRVQELLEKQANGEPLPLGAVGPKKPSNAVSASSGRTDKESISGLVNNVSLDMDAFNNASPATGDSSDDMLLKPEGDRPPTETIDPISGESVKYTAAAPDAESADGEETKIALDPLVFSSTPLQDTVDNENTLNSASASQNRASVMDLGKTPAGPATDNSKDALPSSLDGEISLLAEQASQRVQQKNTDSSVTSAADEWLEDSNIPSLDGSDDVTADPSTSDVTAEPELDTSQGTADWPVLDQTLDASSSAAMLEDFEHPTFTESAVPPSGSVSATASTVADTMSNDEELAFLNSSIEKNRETIIDQQREVLHQTDALSGDLERQADTWLPKDKAENAGVAAARLDAASATATGPVAAESGNGPGRIDEILNPGKSLSDTELLSGPGKLYRVFSRGPEDTKAVPSGWSWAAMFFTFPWLLVRQMPGTALAYALLWVVVLTGLVVTGLDWLDTSAGGDIVVPLWHLGFTALTIIGLVLVPLIMANRWLAHSLKGRGYEEIATVRARDKDRAVERIVPLVV